MKIQISLDLLYNCCTLVLLLIYLDNGTNTRFVQEVLGHNFSKTTQRHTLVSQRFLKWIESPIERILKNKKIDNHYVKK
ncbi:hypothetical protein N9H53_01610 [Flavobacteriaceae bacterium]|nr:hypothetical protein [Flavobacteriaceae bacterium]